MKLPLARVSSRLLAPAVMLVACAFVDVAARAQASRAARNATPASASSRDRAVPEAVRELEEAESRLRGGVYQVPLPVPEGNERERSASTDASKTRAPGSVRSGESAGARGIDITPTQESGEKSSAALADIAARVAALQARAASVRTRVLLLQDQMAARLDDVGYAHVSLLVRDPAGNTSRHPLAVHELSATLDDVPLVERHQPRRLERDATFALYEGPLPAGKYALRVRLVVGLLASGWPARVGQGRWLIDETLAFENVPARDRKGVDAVVIVEPADGDGRPTVRLQVREAR